MNKEQMRGDNQEAHNAAHDWIWDSLSDVPFGGSDLKNEDFDSMNSQEQQTENIQIVSPEPESDDKKFSTSEVVMELDLKDLKQTDIAPIEPYEGEGAPPIKIVKDDEWSVVKEDEKKD